MRPSARDQNAVAARPDQGDRRAAPDRLDFHARPRRQVNLAPYSFFNAFSSSPPIVGFSSEGMQGLGDLRDRERRIRRQPRKLRSFSPDERNLRDAAAGTERIRTRRADDGAVPAGQGAARRRGARGDGVQGESRWSSCKSHSGEPLDNYLVLGEVVGVHIDDACIAGRPFRHSPRETAGALRLSGLFGGRQAGCAGAAGGTVAGRSGACRRGGRRVCRGRPSTRSG